MSNRLSEGVKVSVPLVATSISNTNAIGNYIPMARCRRLLAVLSNGAAAFGKTVKLELLEATSAAGASAAAITGATATGTANTLVKAVTITLTSAANADTVTVNGVTYTKAAATAGASFLNAAALIIMLNAVEGLVATASSEVVTVKAKDGYSLTVTSTGTAPIATTESIVTVEIDEGQIASTTTHVAPKVTSTGAGYATVTFIQEMKALPVSQANLAAHYPA
jgi:hypothetical protein